MSTRMLCRTRALIIEKTILDNRRGLNAQSVLPRTIKRCFSECASDAERLWLLDLLGSAHDASVALMVDDVHMRSSHPAICLKQLEALHTYGTTFGVVFETGDAAKTSFLADGLQMCDRTLLQEAASGSLQAGTPTLVNQTNFLGVPQTQGAWTSRPRRRDSSRQLCDCEIDVVLKVIEVKAAIARQISCSTARSTSWPLVARKFHLTFAVCRIAYMAPLCVAHPRAGLRFSLIQERWVQAVLYGVGLGKWQGRLPRTARLQLLSDLGWPHLWRQVQAQAICMYARMRIDATCWPHSAAVHGDNPVDGSWVFAVRGFITKFGITAFESPLEPSPSRVRYAIKRYRVTEVEPKLGMTLGQPLPWCWLASSVHSLFPSDGFECWWSYRIFGMPDRTSPARCALCHADVVPNAAHLSAHCVAFRLIAARHGFDESCALELPTPNGVFASILRGFSEVASAFRL